MGSDPKKTRPFRTPAPARCRPAPWSYACCVLGGMMLVLVIRIVVDHCRPAAATTPVQTAVTGTWGVMKKQTLMMDRPSEAFEGQAPEEIHWVFGGTSPEHLRELFQSSGLSARDQSLLLNEQLWQWTNDAIIVRPPLEVIREMNPAARQRIYDVLARTPENLGPRYPYVFRGSFEEWFAGCPLPDARREEVRHMIYQKDQVSFFADIYYFQLTAPSNDLALIARQVSRVPVVFARLEIQQPDRLQELKRYWLPPGDASGSWPLVESLARQPFGSLNISVLLPPLPRLLLYRYPRPAAGIPRNADCVWSSMNFFNEQPDDRFVAGQFTGQTLNTLYRPVPKADAFGDIIMLHKPGPDGSIDLIHMCVQIADDVVFTKNGGDVFQPWILMHLEDVRALFSYEPVINTTVFRHRTRA